MRKIFLAIILCATNFYANDLEIYDEDLEIQEAQEEIELGEEAEFGEIEAAKATESTKRHTGLYGEAGYGFNYYQYKGSEKMNGWAQTAHAKLGFKGDEYGMEANFYTTFDSIKMKQNIDILTSSNVSYRAWGADLLWGSNISTIIGDGHDGLAYFGRIYAD